MSEHGSSSYGKIHETINASHRCGETGRSKEAAKKIHDFTTINLATAERIAETCERLARSEGVAISVYVLDNDGNHVYMHRMDGQGYLNIVTAEMKARTALMARAPSKARMNTVIQNPDAELQQIQI